MSVHSRDDAEVPGGIMGGGDGPGTSTCSVDMRFLPKDLDHAVRLLEMPRDGGVVLNYLAVEIDDDDAAVRRVREMHGVKPRVA